MESMCTGATGRAAAIDSARPATLGRRVGGARAAPPAPPAPRHSRDTRRAVTAIAHRVAARVVVPENVSCARVGRRVTAGRRRRRARARAARESSRVRG
ncbi:hypothetical protein EVAR_33057_1 [Eumeta japonica]|uniref:Uncharacterized protein n=1 Tax=Eumeta variegata TaxID=151549 RepID=A0A4C1WT89_EUMVA|nr:hypothetical protein EVAR_33057_1 [Eumeta japonica]